MTRSVVLPLAIGYAGIVALLVAAARPREIAVRPSMVSTALGGFAVLMVAMTVYCGLRGGAAGSCLAEPLRGAGPLTLIAVGAFGVFDAISRRRRAPRQPPTS